MGLRQSPLGGVHEERGATLTEFGGWEMPVEFDSIREEHEQVRTTAGVFDVSHMGEVEVSGPDALELMQRLTTNDVGQLDPGESQYSMIVDEAGVIQDDTIVYDLPDASAADYLFVPNAGHDAEATERWERYRDEWDLDATVENVTEEYGMLAIQGPDAADVLGPATDVDLADLDWMDVVPGTVAGADCLVARSGYTGEDGFEVLVPWADTGTVWEAVDCQPCGLGARDTLRLEMGFLLSGQDFDPVEEPRTPYEAGVGWTVELDTEFLGRDALERVHEEGPDEKLTGLVLVDRGVPRHGYEVTDPDGAHLGQVTSGTMSPTTGEPIAMAYLPVEYAEPDTSVRVVLRGEPKKARTRAVPFIDRP